MNDGLILDQLFTISGGNLRGIIESEGRAGVVGFFTAGLAGAISPTNEMRLDYVPMGPLRGPQGAQYVTWMPMSLSRRFVITRDARNPEAIFRLGDLMCSEEGTVWSFFGAPERDWRLPRPGERSMYDFMGMPARIARILPWGAIQNSHWSQGQAGIFHMGLIDGQVTPDNPLDNEIWVANSVPLMLNYAPPAERRVDFVIFSQAEQEEMTDLRLNINTYVNESLALFVMGQRNIEREWDSYIAELNRMGLNRYIQLMQAGHDRAQGRR
jgi:putative aldouronate transport system substrate-binding protein